MDPLDPLFDLARDRTQDLRRAAEAARRERALRSSTTSTLDQRPSAAVEIAVEVGAGPCLPAGTARAA